VLTTAYHFTCSHHVCEMHIILPFNVALFIHSSPKPSTRLSSPILATCSTHLIPVDLSVQQQRQQSRRSMHCAWCHNHLFRKPKSTQSTRALLVHVTLPAQLKNTKPYTRTIQCSPRSCSCLLSTRHSHLTATRHVLQTAVILP